MQIITANRLVDGEVVWCGRGNRWVDSVAAAQAFEDGEDVEDALAEAHRSVDRQEVVDPYALEVTRVDGAVTPRTLKERIRARGPTNRLDLGKQARRAARAA